MYSSENETAGPQFGVESRSLGSGNLLILRGHLGFDATGELLREAQRLSGDSKDVDVDWRETETVTGGCLQLLLALSISLSEKGQTLRVTGDSPNVRRRLELAGLSSRFPVLEPQA